MFLWRCSRVPKSGFLFRFSTRNKSNQTTKPHNISLPPKILNHISWFTHRKSHNQQLAQKEADIFLQPSNYPAFSESETNNPSIHTKIFNNQAVKAVCTALQQQNHFSILKSFTKYFVKLLLLQLPLQAPFSATIITTTIK